MEIYRAVAKNRIRKDESIGHNPGHRLPGNVSYLADNLWEYMRPQGMPSRRNAIYASPTPALALKNATAHAPEGYVVCRMEFRTGPAIYQLPVPDARDHEDIGRLQKLVNRALGDWNSTAISEKLALAPLFIPGITKGELAAAVEHNALLRAVVEKAAAEVTFWNADQRTVAPTGELFFELVNGNTYTLHPL